VISFKVTTTSVDVTLNDLGKRVLTHPISDFDLLNEFSYEELSSSEDLKTAISNGLLTIENEDSNIITHNPFDFSIDIYNRLGLVESNIRKLYFSGNNFDVNSDSTNDIQIYILPSGSDKQSNLIMKMF